MREAIEQDCIDTLFHNGRTVKTWHGVALPADAPEQIYALTKLGPTSANCCPARFVFIKSEDGKARLKPHLMGGNVEPTMAAPLTVIVALDTQFREFIPEVLWPQNPDAKTWFADGRTEDAMRNGSLQGAYMIMAARALGFDCHPMSGFDKAGVDKAFFPEGRWQSNFLCNIGYGDREGMHERLPRLDFDTACQVV